MSGEKNAIKEFKVKASTNAASCAGSLRERFREGYTKLRLTAVGQEANMQVIKTIVELNKMMSGPGTYISIVPWMEDRPMERRGTLSTPTYPLEVTVVFVYRLVVNETV